MTTAISGGVALVDFARPDRANSLDEAAWRDLRTTFEQLSTDEEVRVVLLTGSGRHWCAGMDLSVLTGLRNRIQPEAGDATTQLKAFIQDIQDCISAIERCNKPVIAAIQGGCIGGGVAIATACDARYCTEDAYFNVKEVDFGIVADIGTLQRLPKIIGRGLTTTLALSGGRLLAAEAKDCRLVNKVLPDRVAMMKYLENLTDQIAGQPVQVIEGIKSSIAYSMGSTTEDGLEHVADLSSRLMADGAN